MKRETLVTCIKQGLHFIADAGIELLFGTAAAKLAEQRGANKIEKACMVFGGAVLGGTVSNAADRYICDTIDDALDLWDTFGGIKEDMKDLKEGETNE